ncbi:MAG: hypothetical protein ACM3ZQ_02575 [Bacillota bacterium]
MAFWEGVFGNLTRSNAHTTDHCVDEISELKLQLVELGYNPLEVDYMVTMHSDGSDLNRLDRGQLETIVEALRAQVVIARQCVQAVRRA